MNRGRAWKTGATAALAALTMLLLMALFAQPRTPAVGGGVFIVLVFTMFALGVWTLWLDQDESAMPEWTGMCGRTWSSEPGEIHGCRLEQDHSGNHVCECGVVSGGEK